MARAYVNKSRQVPNTFDVRIVNEQGGLTETYEQCTTEMVEGIKKLHDCQ